MSLSPSSTETLANADPECQGVDTQSPRTPERTRIQEDKAPDLCDIAKRFSATQSQSTPYARNNSKVQATSGLVEQKRAIMDELGDSISVTTLDYAQRLYNDLATDEEVRAFLGATPLYDIKKKAWSISTPTRESDLYEPLTQIISAILQDLGGVNVGSRKVVDTHAAYLHHQEAMPTTIKTSPDISIQATGPSFEVPSDRHKSVGYTNIASCVDAKMEKAMDSVTEQAKQLGSYSRQLFIQQPNRRFVRSLIVSEKKARLWHFDRSGAQYTPPIDINKDPTAFIRIVLGLGSTDERVLGLDTSVQWKTGSDGRKKSGTITVSEGVKEVVYDLVQLTPTFIRHSIRGRGTTCWKARDANGKELLIKDSWRTESRTPEHVYLQKAKGLPGVAQMISSDDMRGETKDFRGKNVKGGFHNRISTRIVMEAYGLSLCHFTSIAQALGALRDAIAGHRNLLAKGVEILHRDISMNNILIGAPGAPAPNRGVLIDLDMAIFIDREISKMSPDFLTGTRMYQSIAVLTGWAEMGDPAPAHDHLDDLESFFYVLCDLMYSFRAPGKLQQPRPPLLDRWDKSDPLSAGDSKKGHIYEPINDTIIPPFWVQPARDLLESYHELISGVVREKTKLCRRATAEKREQGFSELILKINDHYADVLKMFDVALGQIEAAGPVKTPPPSPSRPLRVPTSPQQNAIPHGHAESMSHSRQSRGTKRASESEHHEVPPTKRKATAQVPPVPRLPTRRSTRNLRTQSK